MIEFWLKVGIEPVDKEHLERIWNDFKFKKFSWPVLPRVGEWIQPDDDTATPILDVWHWTEEGLSRIEIEIQVSEYEYDQLTEVKGWVRHPR